MNHEPLPMHQPQSLMTFEDLLTFCALAFICVMIAGLVVLIHTLKNKRLKIYDQAIRNNEYCIQFFVKLNQPNHPDEANVSFRTDPIALFPGYSMFDSYGSQQMKLWVKSSIHEINPNYQFPLIIDGKLHK